MSSAQPILAAAAALRNQAFSKVYAETHNGARLEAYCAAFVRYCFAAGGKRLPVIAQPEFYKHLGIRYVGVENTADSLSGLAVGQVVPSGQAAGDILLFRNTITGYPYGTITHVGIAADSHGMMFDAGSGSIVHHRSIATFGGGQPGRENLLVEVRRPMSLGAVGATHETASGLPHRMENNATRVHFKGGTLSLKHDGKPVGRLNVLVTHSGDCGVEGHLVHPSVVSLIIHDKSGKVYKMHRHHGVSSITDGVDSFWISCDNGLLQASWSDPTHKALDRKTGRLEPAWNALKPESLELLVAH